MKKILVIALGLSIIGNSSVQAFSIPVEPVKASFVNAKNVVVAAPGQALGIMLRNPKTTVATGAGLALAHTFYAYNRDKKESASDARYYARLRLKGITLGAAVGSLVIAGVSVKNLKFLEAVGAFYLGKLGFNFLSKVINS
ncbi:hypothetical protein HOM50_04675 [bacterium]|jgi:hypothetical protein|nr:hypothetical protein [bacterium]MBT5015674.1 hypothetical protein [bacterium]